MVEIQVNPKVLVALAQAFPKPPNSAQRALEKYVRVLTAMLLKSLQRGQSPMEAKLNSFSLSLHELANQGGQIGKKKIRVHAWLRDNNLELVKAIEIGTNLTGMVSQVKLTDLVTLIWHEPEKTENKITIDGVVFDEQLIKSDSTKNAELFNQLYPEFDAAVQAGTFKALFDALEIDVQSLQNYLQWLTEDSKHFKSTKLNSYLFQARIILAVAQHTGGTYYQRKKPSEFGRMYYAGTSVQNVNKQLRHAMLGNCWEYDIRSSVVAWKMGFADEWVKHNQPNSTVSNCFINSLTYLDHKDSFINNVQKEVFGKDSDHKEEFQLKLLKQALTALSFGARKSGISWQNRDGEWETSAIANIFQIKEERDSFLNNLQVSGFIDEQSQLDMYLFNGVKKYSPSLLTLTYLQTQSGQPSKSKVIAYLYQHSETVVMDIVRAAMTEFNKTIIANIHDAIIIRQRLSADDKHEIEYRMQEQTQNPYWRLGATEVKRWEPNNKEAQKEEALHKQRMKDFEELAKGYTFDFNQFDFGRSNDI